MLHDDFVQCRILITIATYIANLAAYQTIGPPSGVVIDSLMDFVGKKIAVSPIFGPLAKSLYPSLPLTILATTVSIADSFNMLKNGTYDVLFASRIFTPAVILV